MCCKDATAHEQGSRQAGRLLVTVHRCRAVFLLWLLLSHPTPRPPTPSPTPPSHTHTKVAEEYLDVPEFYYPHTLDFRGRAYPLHPNMHHLGEQRLTETHTEACRVSCS